MLDKVINTNKRFEVPLYITVGDEVISVRRPWVRNRVERVLWKNKKTAKGRNRFWKDYRREHPGQFEKYMKAGKWLTPAEGERVYGKAEA